MQAGAAPAGESAHRAHDGSTGKTVQVAKTRPAADSLTTSALNRGAATPTCSQNHRRPAQVHFDLVASQRLNLWREYAWQPTVCR